jgi:hypothetical protein
MRRGGSVVPCRAVGLCCVTPCCRCEQGRSEKAGVEEGRSAARRASWSSTAGHCSQPGELVLRLHWEVQAGDGRRLLEERGVKREERR